MRTPDSGSVPGPAPSASYAAVPRAHPAHAARPVAGSKGDAWIVTLPADAAAGSAVLAFDTGIDGTTIVIGGLDGGPRRHPTHDCHVVVTAGSGVLGTGDDPAALHPARFTAPCTLVIPAGRWHSLAMDAGSPAPVTFFTRPGAVIDRFSEVGPRATQGSVTLAALPVSTAATVPARVVPGLGALAASAASAGSPAAATASAATGSPAAAGGSPAAAMPDRPVRVEPYPEPGDTYVLPLDTGSDTLFVMASRGRSWDRAPIEVPVHRHDDEDEYIVLGGGQGWLLNGPSPETVQRVPFTGPCLLVMPSGNFHRVVREDDDVVDSVLVYAHRRALAAPWDTIVAEMEVVAG